MEKTLQHSCLKLCLKYLWCFRVDVAIFSSYCSTQLPVHLSVLISASLTSWHWLKPTAGRPEQSPSGARMLRRLMTTACLMLGCGERTYHAPCAHRPVTAESCHVKRQTHMHAQRTNMQVHTVIPLFIRTHTHIHTHGLTRLFMTDIKNAKGATLPCDCNRHMLLDTLVSSTHTHTRTHPAC